MKNKVITIMISMWLLLLTACSTHTHVVGNGPSTGITESKRQYYVLFGLVKLNSVDTNAMIGDATDFQIESKYGFVDYLIAGLAGAIVPAGFHARTVTVTK